MSDLHDLIGRHGEAIAWWQMCLRAVLIFLAGLAFVRLAGKRVFGKWGALDIVLAVIVGSNLSRTITGGAPFFATLAATGTLVLLHTVLVYAAIWLPPIGGWMKGRPTELIRDGVTDAAALRRHAVGAGDLAQALRRAGVDSPERVASAVLERNGDISVVLRAPDRTSPR